MLQYHRDRRKVLNIHSDGMGRVERRVHDKDTEIGGEGGTEREGTGQSAEAHPHLLMQIFLAACANI